ncbi:hypothetical protein D6853_11210 [Butyrivibrio sp. X503]|uniref:hypothetical protein n=1 Tax=Butyrivibrio sp. X503 TaxID=2364878 RepID=UPI000EA8FD7D|nr:hypothetical protein [Butyrivibrio sp. X503]RKM55280.1 hypothetical protein D6853_11210 [Butyrivibrio sp. X503]
MNNVIKRVICVPLIVTMIFIVFGGSAHATEAKTVAEASVYEGSGDSVIELEDRTDAWVLYVKGNSSGRHFSVKGYNEDGNGTELFVNTTDKYEGITLDPSLSTTILEISATGDWHIEQRSIFTLDIVQAGDIYTGSGDSVLLVASYGKTAKITGNKSERHFAVKSYGSSRNSLLVNTTDKYEGTVMMKGEPMMIEIKAVGDWTIEF